MVSYEQQRRAERLRLAGLLALWYASSVVTSLSTKEILRRVPYPITVALIQQCAAALLGWVGSRRARPQPNASTDWVATVHAVIPVAACMVVSIVAYRWSLLSVSVAFVHTIKTLGPLWTLIFSHLLLREPCCALSQLGVLPVVLGVAITTVTEAEFHAIGFVAAVASTAAAALQMVLAKQMLTKHGISKDELFYQVATYSLLLLTPLFALIDLWRLQATGLGALFSCAHWLLLNALCTFVNQYTGLTVLDAMASPLSHAIANVMKRAVVITIAMLFARRPVTPLHACGCALSVFGSFIYQQATRCAAATSPTDYEALPLRGVAVPASPRHDPDDAFLDSDPFNGSRDVVSPGKARR
jgi:solute carrier family 35 protein E1